MKANSLGVPYYVDPSYRRKYSHISFSFFFREHLSESLNIIERNRAHVKTMEFNYETLDLERLVNAIGSMPRLERFKLNNCNFLWDNRKVAIPSLPALKHLDFCGKYKFLKYFSKSKLTSLTAGDLTWKEVEIFKEFVGTQQALKSLEVSLKTNIMTANEPRSFVIGGTYPYLTKLTIKPRDHFLFDFNTEVQIINFLLSVSSTLQELDFHCIAPNSVYLTIFKNMPALKKLSVTVAFLPKQMEFYSLLMPSKAINDLGVVFEHSDRSIERVLRCFQHIECLRAVIKGYSPPFFAYSSHIGMFALREIRPDLAIPLVQLKSLHYEQSGGLWLLNVLPHLYPSLEMLSLSEICYPHVTNDVVNHLKEFRKLRHVRVRGGRKSMAKFYGVVNEAKLERIESMEIVVIKYHETSENVFSLKMTTDRVLEACNFLSSTGSMTKLYDSL